MALEDSTDSKLPNSLWANTAIEAPDTRPLTGHQTAAVVVIGGGFTGLSAALHLAEAGISVTVLEAEDIGYGGSGRNVGLVNAGLWLNPDDIEAKLGKEYGQRLNKTLGAAPDLVFSLIKRFGIQCEANRNGTLHLSHSQSGDRYLARKTEQLIKRGVPVKLLNAATTAEKTGTEAYRGALFDPRAGTIQPLSYARGLATTAQSLGARIYTRSAVLKLATETTGDWKITTETGEINARNVIIATNAYSKELWKNLRQSFTPLYYFQFATNPLSSEALNKILPQKQACWDTRQVMSSFRLDDEGRLIIGSIGEFSDKRSRFLQGWASHQLLKLFPKIFDKTETNRETFWQHGWSGRIAFSPDHLPHLHNPAPGLLACMGYSGRGIGPGTVMGKAMADHLLGTPVEDLPLPCSQPYPVFGRRIREQYYAYGSDLYHIYQRVI
ncbi:FAD-binding oxidoreductase [Motiliproteus sp. MSK22-1]|uniref:NAD(P)/FAD-dependent oxidoreductase n=1 Tax=Motiliproteus sp. MSK22-1 TaxID=1897630 RepID=UPI0009761790|nr:FAD-binding oxidoreductase [Motiliproteus sp. MSK22-1]OMH29172.1 hypothetical protein BGP75_20740 [Motiliproteus sp. MSK22-1]